VKRSVPHPGRLGTPGGIGSFRWDFGVADAANPGGTPAARHSDASRKMSLKSFIPGRDGTTISTDLFSALQRSAAALAD
jgi:hypothetical protein